MSNGVGIYGSTSSTEIAPGGIYAGYFRGDVKATGTIYGTLVSPSSVSSPSQGGTTINLSEEATRGETITEKLRQVDLLQMERVNQDGSLAANKVIEKENILDENWKDVSAEEPIQTKLSSVSYGLAADQLKEVYPELVYEDKDGNYSINYVEMVPILVQAINELSAKVEALEAERGNSKAIKARSSSMDVADNVNLSIPAKAQKIQLNIYDLSGKQVRTMDVNGSGDVRLSTYTKGLSAGTYAYSLIVDGKVRFSRKVIVQHI
ncbi:MAG: T9SS type A sorting domain-containing protein [Bacteroidaceae bacterium]|nr:T9SS type A sorting domain-containing protein [Bacteroidaceae bacterium]